jgi:hypothetical protein
MFLLEYTDDEDFYYPSVLASSGNRAQTHKAFTKALETKYQA